MVDRTGLIGNEKQQADTLTVLIEILNEVGLGLQLPIQLVGLDEAETPLLAFENLATLHLLKLRKFIIIIRIY